MRAMDVMTRDVITVGPNTSVSDIAALLLRRRISGVPVVDGNGKLLGRVSEGDLVRRVETGTDRRGSWWLDLLTEDRERAATYAKTHGRKASDVMTKDVVTASETMLLRDVAGLMERHRVKREFVESGHDRTAAVRQTVCEGEQLRRRDRCEGSHQSNAR